MLFYLPADINNLYSPDRDVVSMTVSGFSGLYNKTFEIPASGDIGGVENSYDQSKFSAIVDQFIPLSGYRFVGVITDLPVGSVEPSCTVTLTDKWGLESSVAVSTSATTLTEIYVDPAAGDDGNPGSDVLPVKTIEKALEKLSGMTNTTIILVDNVDVQNTLSFTASHPDITLKGGATPVTLTYSGTGRAITVSGGKLTLGENITITGADDGAVEITGGEFVMSDGSTISGNGDTSSSGGGVYVSTGGTFTMSGGTISDDIYVIGNFSLTETPTIAGNTITLASGASIDVNDLTATNIPDVTFIPSYTEGSTVLTNATEDICNFFTEFLGSVPTNELWWIGPENGNGVLKTIEGTYDESTNTITVPTVPGTKDELQNTVNGSAESGVKVEITGGGTITVDSTVSVPGGADVAIKPASGSSVDITASGKTTVFEVQDGGNLTLGGEDSGTVIIKGDQSVSYEDGKDYSLINVSGGTVNIGKNTEIRDNEAGRGVTVTDGKLIMTGGSITENSGGQVDGGGVFVSGPTASFEMSGGEISKNWLKRGGTNRQGGGVCVYNGAVFTLKGDDAEIYENSAQDGGAVCVKDGFSEDKKSTFNMYGGTIRDNSSSGVGAVYIRAATAIMYMTGGTIKNNTATLSGFAGGIHIHDGTFDGTGAQNASVTGNKIGGQNGTNKDISKTESSTYIPGNVTVGVGP